MKGNVVEKSDLIGQIEGYPIEVVQAMVDEQIRQGNKADVVVFQWDKKNLKDGFDWAYSPHGFKYWQSIIENEDLRLFYDKTNAIDSKLNPPSERMNDTVNHPSHYTSHPSGIECIDVTENYDFLVGNAIKYLWRAGIKKEVGKEDKEKEIEDLNKAVWYINRKIAKLQKMD